jgi:hypothetical protein
VVRQRPARAEQVFTLARPPAGGGRIALTFSLTGTLRPALEHGSLALGTSLRYTGLSAHDARGRSLAAHLALEGSRLTISVADRGASTR